VNARTGEDHVVSLLVHRSRSCRIRIQRRAWLPLIFPRRPFFADQIRCPTPELHSFSRRDSLENLFDWRSRDFALEDLLDVRGQRLAARFCAADQLAMQPVGNVSDLDPFRHGLSIAQVLHVGRGTR
jgi:hypothetical protein